MPQESTNYAATGCIEQLGHRAGWAAAVGNEHLLANWREGNGFYVSYAKVADGFPARSVPQNGRLGISGEHLPAVRGKGHATYNSLRRKRMDELAAGRIPQPGGIVRIAAEFQLGLRRPAASEHLLAVGGKSNPVDQTVMREGAEFLVAGCIPLTCPPGWNQSLC
jgi:hypothetical protein